MVRPRDPYELAREKYPWAYQDEPGPSRARQLAGDLANLAITLVLLVGLPIVMLHVAPWPPLPIPHHLDLTREGIQGWYNGAPWEDPRLVIGAGVTVGWICWAILLLDTAYTVLLAVVDAVRYRRLRPRIPGRSPTRVAARLVVAGLIAVTVAITSRLTAAHAAPPAPPAAVAAQHQPHSIDLDQPVTLTAHRGSARIHTVVEGDTLWNLARRYLHDPQQWRAIYRANRGHLQPDGRRLIRPDLLQPGWRLRIPTGQHSADHHRQSAPRPTTPHRSGHHAAARGGHRPETTPKGPQGSVTSEAAPRRAGPGDSRIRLPGGSLVAAGLASLLLAGITAAAAMRWRRRFRPHNDDRPTVADIPLTRALRAAAVPSGRPQPGADASTGQRRPVGEENDLSQDGLTEAPSPPEHVGVECLRDRGRPVDGDSGECDPDEWDADEWDAAQPNPRTPRPDHSAPEKLAGGPVDAGADAQRRHELMGADPEHGDAADQLALVDRPLTALTGPGAVPAARALLARHLAATAAAHVVMAAEHAQMLLEVDTAPRVPRLAVTATVDEALTLLDADLIGRRRIRPTADAGGSDEQEMGARSVLFAAPVTGAARARLTGQLAQDGIYAVLCDPSGAGEDTALHVDASGRLTQPDGAAVASTRVDLMTATDLRQLLGALSLDEPGTALDSEAGSVAAPDSPPSPRTQPADQTAVPGSDASEKHRPEAESRGHTDAESHSDNESRAGAVATPAGDDRDGDREQLAAGGPAGNTDGPCDETERGEGAGDRQQPGGGSAQLGPAEAGGPMATAPGPADRDDDGPPVTAPKALVRVLGPPRVHRADGQPVSGLRARAGQILTFLVLQERTGATLERLIEATVEDTVRRSAAQRRMYTDLANLRGVLAAAAGDTNPTPGSYILLLDNRYRIDTERVSVDRWQMRAALDDATAAVTEEQRIAALHRAVDCYHGEFGAGIDHLWVMDARTSALQDALVAAATLADHYLAERPDKALQILRRAIDWSPYTEDLYQRMMRVHHRLRSPDGVRTTLRTLTARLADIDEVPTPKTQQLARTLLHDPES
ncbi:LysM peptidoglycan-binding domain-containing protein [Actinocatenispora comari]|uniref:LysM domain-containing protein n=1 Tax=Actinocatenispora comari TaxID=2807577 RepID=A0A8J4ADK0_9ACTN|nr:LysM peptidoglycan-binding domain-containing protein [Actinocatenispora comari]GIL29083.1 hypothetical protein NUM_43370 [Actinocatenispora comari]